MDNALQKPGTRAWMAVSFFALVGLFSWLYIAPDSRFLLPDTIFFIVLVTNTFFSVRFFARIQPSGYVQLAIDGLLIVSYIALALSMGRPLAFVFAGLCLFILATAKYALMVGYIPHEHVLHRKILIDLAGVAMCVAVLGGVLADWPLTSAWALAILFALANVYLLLIRPMYRL